MWIITDRWDSLVDGQITAYMDMEFGGICGTWQRMKVPVEAGLIVSDPGQDILTFVGRKFRYDLDITVWKNVTDELGRTVGKNPCTPNPSQSGSEVPGNRKIRISSEQRKTAHRISTQVHNELQEFMRRFNSRDISKIVFFAADYEQTALAQARVNLTGFEVRDIQRDLRAAFSMKEVMSLDRFSHVIEFKAKQGKISSLRFRYTVPAGFRDWLDSHISVGDSARMFLLSQELQYHTGELGERIKEYLRECEETKKPGAEEKELAQSECTQGSSGETE